MEIQKREGHQKRWSFFIIPEYTTFCVDILTILCYSVGEKKIKEV